MLEEWRATRVGAGSGAAETVQVPGRPSAFADADAVRYVAEVEDPLDGGDEVAVLHLNGCYAHATVELSGSVLGPRETPISHDAYFAPLRIPFRPTDEVRIAVTCEAPRDRFGGLHDTDRVPRAAGVPAIWWAADLETNPLPYVDRVTVRPALTDEGARLHVRTTVVAEEQLEERVTYSLKPAGDLSTRGTMERATVETAGPGATTVEHTIDVRDPALWWPRGHGEQHRYTLRASLGESEYAVTTGIRSVARTDDGLRVNGEPVPVRGVNLTTADPADVERAAACNANLVRAHAHVLPPAVYEACDEAGLMVWQDLPLTGPGAFDVDRGRDLARAVAETYRHHPSLAVAGVHDEPTAAFADGLGSGFLDSLRLRWRAWRTDYDGAPAERVGEAVPDWLPVFPAVGDPGTGTAARRLFPGWDYATAADAPTLLDRYPAEVLAEFGAGAAGAGEIAGAADLDRAKYDAHAHGDDESLAYQASVLEAVAAAGRIAGVGTIAYSLRDTDGAGMGVYDVDGGEKPGASALAQAFEPVQAFLVSPESGTSEVVVCNDLPTALSAELHWETGGQSGSESISVGAGERWRGGPIELPAGEAVTLEVRTDAGSVANEYHRGE